MLVMEARGMSPSDPQQARDGLCGDLYQTSCRSDTTAFSQMVDDILRSGFGELGIAQGGATSLGKLLSTAAPTQQAETVMALHFPDHQVGRASLAKQLACGIHTG